ncbi:MAG: RidA family protein [Alphaproteobacteria bacterium]
MIGTNAPSRRQHVFSDGLWGMQIEVPYPKALRCSEMVFTCGQCDLDAAGKPQRPGDLLGQSARTMNHAYGVTAQAGAHPEDMARFQVFYASDGTVDEDAYLGHLAASVRDAGGRRAYPIVMATPLPYFYYPGMMVEIDAVAMIGGGARPRQVAGEQPSWLPTPFAPALRAGELIHIGMLAPRRTDGRVLARGDAAAQTEILLAELADRLSALGANFGDLVKLNTYYVAAPGTWRKIAETRAKRFAHPGPAATDIPLPALWPEGVLVRMDAIAMRGTDGAVLAKIYLSPEGLPRGPHAQPFAPAVQCRDKVFIGAQAPLDEEGKVIDAGLVEPQTSRAMNSMGKLLALAGLDYRHVVKANTYYRGGPNPEDLHANMQVRNRYYARPGPASTGVPLPEFDAPGQTLVLEAFAMSD